MEAKELLKIFSMSLGKIGWIILPSTRNSLGKVAAHNKNSLGKVAQHNKNSLEKVTQAQWTMRGST